jgi:hypothetical protein
VRGGVRDRAREAERVDLPGRQPALLLQLADQLAPVEVLHGADERGRVHAFDRDDLGLHRVLDRGGERVGGLDRVGGVLRRVRRHRQRLAERHQDPRAERLPRLEGEPDRHQPERRHAGGGGPRLVLERDPRRAGLDALDAGLGVGRALGIDRDEATGLEAA